MSVDAIFEVIGEPKMEKLVRCDGQALTPGMPEQLVKATEWDSWIDEDEEDVRLIDFGEAFTHDDIPTELAEPWGLQVPEKIFTGRFDYRVDLWRAGCLVRLLSVLNAQKYTETRADACWTDIHLGDGP
jgi:hypothetical protein